LSSFCSSSYDSTGSSDCFSKPWDPYRWNFDRVVEKVMNTLRIYDLLPKLPQRSVEQIVVQAPVPVPVLAPIPEVAPIAKEAPTPKAVLISRLQEAEHTPEEAPEAEEEPPVDEAEVEEPESTPEAVQEDDVDFLFEDDPEYPKGAPEAEKKAHIDEPQVEEPESTPEETPDDDLDSLFKDNLKDDRIPPVSEESDPHIDEYPSGDDAARVEKTPVEHTVPQVPEEEPKPRKHKKPRRAKKFRDREFMHHQASIGKMDSTLCPDREWPEHFLVIVP
jgi:hypothetical protein